MCEKTQGCPGCESNQDWRKVNGVTPNKKTRYEILPLREHRRISLHCPKCEQFLLMDIRKKARIKGKVTWYVMCPNCSHSFKQVGRPYNYWRDIKSRYNLDSKQVLAMQTATVRECMDTWDQDVPLIYEDDRTIRVRDMTLIKPLSPSQGTRPGSPTGKTTKKQ